MEKRENHRIKVNLRALLHVNNEVNKARVVNLGLGGLFLWTRYPDLCLGTDVGIDLDGESVGHVMNVSGHVVHKNKLGMGVEITKADKNFGLLVKREGGLQ